MNKPVAYFLKYKDETYIECPSSVVGAIPLYTHPAELTDEEIISTMVQFDVYSSDDHCLIDAGKAILRKAQEK